MLERFLVHKFAGKVIIKQRHFYNVRRFFTISCKLIDLFTKEECPTTFLVGIVVSSRALPPLSCLMTSLLKLQTISTH